MKQVNLSCVLLLVSLMNSCHTKILDGGGACSCEEFPFPKACSSKCETGQVQIESVNTKDQTAMIVIRHGSLSESQIIPLNRLPAGVIAERGANFTALLKKEVSAISPAVGSKTGPTAATSSKIIRFTKQP